MKKLFVPALLALLLAAPAMAHDEQCAKTSPEEIASLFDGWNVALATRDPAQVAARYWDDAVLLPTVSNTPRTDTASIADYFVHFLQKAPQGRIDTRTIKIDCNMAADMGTYTFALTDSEGQVSDVAARYTYVYQYRDGMWKIAHHHSSAMPEKPGAAH